MLVPSPQMQAAELRRQEFVAQGIYEQWVEQVLGPAPTARLQRPHPVARLSLPHTLRLSAQYAWQRLRSPASIGITRRAQGLRPKTANQ